MRRRPELARAYLLYGEWLRRAGRGGKARDQLRIAWRVLDEIGMEGFAERARRERATPARPSPGARSRPLAMTPH